MKHPVGDYLDRWAEPEHARAREITGRWRHVVVVPAMDESPELVEGLAPACRAADALVILVVNAPESAPAEVHARNQALLAALAPSADGRARVHGTDLLIVDRASPGQRLPERRGVGLARRIGCDLALALCASRRIEQPWIFSTDADVTLPLDYFSAPRSAADASALVFPFVHTASGDALLDAATAHYEIWLRYYVLGLREARSPFAFHTVGSLIAVRDDAYAAVRGFPRRQAGEDFHLLDKVGKMGSVVRAGTRPVRIRARRSERVPFGTGPGVRRIEAALANGEQPALYHPEAFAELARWLVALEELAASRDSKRLERSLLERPRLAAAVAELGSLERAIRETEQAPDAERLRRRLRASFGALETLQLIHALERQGYERLAWRQAIACAEFTRDVPTGDPFETAAALAALEH